MAHAGQRRSVLGRHLSVLEAFDAWHPFRTLTEIAQVASLPISSVHRLANELTAEGLLERLPDRSYRLGVRLWEFASLTPGALGLRELARPWMVAVHERVRQHVQLGILSGTDVLFLERLSSPHGVVNATLIGGRMPAHASSSGLVLLAFAASDTVDDVMTGCTGSTASNRVRTATELRAQLRQIRADGFAVAEGFVHSDSRGIAVPVRSADASEPHASLGVVVANDGSPVLPYVEILLSAAARISRALAAQHAPGRLATDAPKVAGLYAGISQKSLEYFEHTAARGRAGLSRAADSSDDRKRR